MRRRAVGKIQHLSHRLNTPHITQLVDNRTSTGMGPDRNLHYCLVPKFRDKPRPAWGLIEFDPDCTPQYGPSIFNSLLCTLLGVCGQRFFIPLTGFGRVSGDGRGSRPRVGTRVRDRKRSALLCSATCLYTNAATPQSPCGFGDAQSNAAH